MHGETYKMQQIRQKRERGASMANARWKAVRRRQGEMEDAIRRDPLRMAEMLGPARRIIQRVIVIDEQQRAVELVRWSDTSAQRWAAMKQKAGL